MAFTAFWTVRILCRPPDTARAAWLSWHPLKKCSTDNFSTRVSVASGNPSSVRAHMRSTHSSSDSSDPCTAVVICLRSVLGGSHFPKRFDRALNKGPYSLLSSFFRRSTNFTALSDRQLISRSSRVRLLHWCMLAISLNWNENDCQVPVAPVNVGSFCAGGLRGRRRSLCLRVEWRADWYPDLYDPRERACASSDVSDSVSDGTSEDNDSSDDDESSCCSSIGGRRSPAVACWASDHWVASSNPLRGKFRH